MENENYFNHNNEVEKSNGIHVLKFGGTSVGCAEGIRNLASIVEMEQRISAGVLVVVSAMNGTTDELIELATDNILSDKALLIRKLVDKHLSIIENLNFDPLIKLNLENELFGIFRSIEDETYTITNCTDNKKRRDRIVSYGEILSTTVVNCYLTSRGINSVAVNASEIVKTDDNFGNAAPIWSDTLKNIETNLLPFVKKGTIPVVTGFIGSTKDGEVTTLERGGSDYTATFMARGLGASTVTLYKDVDGVYDKDPNKFPNAVLLREIDFRNADAMAKNGNKVLAKRVIEPLFGTKITLYIKNTFNPDNPGTKISPR